MALILETDSLGRGPSVAWVASATAIRWKRGACMPVYMVQFSYTPEAWATLSKNVMNRRPAVSRLLKQAGGRLIELYYSYGEYDGVVLFDAPDDITAGAAVIAAVSAGHLRAVKMTRLFTAEEGVEMMRKAGMLPFAPPEAAGGGE